YWADPQIFLGSAQFDYQHLVERARQTAFLVPGLELTIVDRRGVARDETGEVIAERVEDFRFDGGITEFVDHLSIDPPITDTWRM
ncbi:DNA topoisomerase IV subunit B, partial [Burkholderia multivorans]